jgi:threonine synthase
MYYRNTRGAGGKIKSSLAIVRGIAPGGGLYVPEKIPRIDRNFKEISGAEYSNAALYVMSKFLTDFSGEELKYCIENAYDKKYDNPLIAPLVEKCGVFFLELFHGPTLAFKDIALSVLPHLLRIAAARNGISKDIVILTATSGDTGKAALEGFKNVEGTRIIVFFPENGVSRVQKRDMITQEGENTYVVAVKGNFDDTQRGVKEIFSDSDYNESADRSGYIFSSANSINIGRLVPQITYYIYAYLTLIKSGKVSPGEAINITVPTGNFGNILAAYYSKKMGLPVKRLICASNENNVLYDFIRTGIYNRERELIVTSSPAMDILVSSNLERLLYDISDNNPEIIDNLMNDLNKKGQFKINSRMKDRMSDFYGGFATDIETAETIKYVFKKHGYLMDTHTAVGFNVYQKYLKETGDAAKAIIVSTASPFKFPGSVTGALDKKYAGMDEFSLIDVLSKISGLKTPETIKNLKEKKIIHTAVCETGGMKDTISSILGL